MVAVYFLLGSIDSAGGFGDCLDIRFSVARKYREVFRRIVFFAFAAVAAFYLFWGGALLALRTHNPPTTGVQIQRRIESIFAPGGGPAYHKRYTFVPLARISPELQHALISAEDGPFYHHHRPDSAHMQTAPQAPNTRA